MSEKLSDRIVQWSYNDGTVERGYILDFIHTEKPSLRVYAIIENEKGGIVTRTVESLEFSYPKFPQKAE